MDINLLRLFCKSENQMLYPYLSYMEEPFNCGGFTYATDGAIAIRTNRIEGLVEIDRPAVHGLVWPDSSSDFKFTIPDIAPSEVSECQECMGRGYSYKCPFCDGKGNLECDLGYTHPCEKCMGESKDKRFKEKCFDCFATGYIAKANYIKIGEALVSDLYLIKMAKLTNIKIRTTGEFTPLEFVFDGGVGLLAPVKEQSKEP